MANSRWDDVTSAMVNCTQATTRLQGLKYPTGPFGNLALPVLGNLLQGKPYEH